MFLNFVNTNFLSIMLDLLRSKNIEPVINEKRSPKELLQYGETLEDCFKSIDFSYFSEAISKLLEEQGYKQAYPNYVFFKTTNLKDGGKSREDFFALIKDLNSFYILGKTPGSIKTALRQIFYGVNGISEQFDIRCKEYLDQAFLNGQLAFSNLYNSQLNGLKWLEAEINSEIMGDINYFKETGLITDETEIKKLLSNMESGMQNVHNNYKFSLFIMSVYSFIEHAAMLIFPFWFAMKDSNTSWNLFCKGFNSSEYVSFRDFWNSKEDWINSFIEVISDCTEFNGSKKPRKFTYNASEDQKLMKRLYDRTRSDYRNPIHHGFSTGRDKTGLSMEVPTLDSKKLNFFNPPLLREIDSKAYQDTKDFLDLFIKNLNFKYPLIMKYIETGWNVPTDCTELCKYISKGNISEFIDDYRTILSHVDYEQLAGIYR